MDDPARASGRPRARARARRRARCRSAPRAAAAPRPPPAPRRTSTSTALGAAEPAAGVERVLGVALGRVVGGAAPRRARPGPRSSRSRRAACARPAPPLRRLGGGLQRDVQAGGAGADDGDVAAHSRSGASGGHVAATVPDPMRDGACSTSRTPPRSSTTPAPTPRTPAGCAAIEAALERQGWLGLERVEAPAASREQLTRVHAAATSTRSRTSAPRGGGMIDLDTVASGGLLRGGAARGRRRRRGRRAAARRRRARRLLRPAPAGPPRRARPGDGLLPVQQRRRRRRPRARRVRGRARPGPRLGRPPRQRDRGDLRRLRPTSSTRASTRARSIPGTGAGRDAGAGAGEGYTRQPARSRRARAATSSSPSSSTSSSRSAADYAPGPDRDLGRLRRPPRRPARQLHARRRPPTRTWPRRCATSAPSSARRVLVCLEGGYALGARRLGGRDPRGARRRHGPAEGACRGGRATPLAAARALGPVGRPGYGFGRGLREIAESNASRLAPSPRPTPTRRVVQPRSCRPRAGSSSGGG